MSASPMNCRDDTSDLSGVVRKAGVLVQPHQGFARFGLPDLVLQTEQSRRSALCVHPRSYYVPMQGPLFLRVDRQKPRRTVLPHARACLSTAIARSLGSACRQKKVIATGSGRTTVLPMLIAQSSLAEPDALP